MPDPELTSKMYDAYDPLSIYEYSSALIGNTLRQCVGDISPDYQRKGKGGLGQMVEEMFFGYSVNSKQEADFKEAGMELKCTPLLKTVREGKYRIKERLVSTMIDYCEVVDTDFDHSHVKAKCELMLLLFYLQQSGVPVVDLRFIFRVLWQIPEKDMLLIRRDYETIVAKIRRGEAHLLSEGDTMYLGACRKGHKGDSPQQQPYSDIPTPKRAFSLKPAYMRYILSHVSISPDGAYTNYSKPEPVLPELVDKSEITQKSFEEIITKRFEPFIGLDYNEICHKLGISAYQSKSKYADISNLIASEGRNKRIDKCEEFIKSGIRIKTIRLRANGMPKEAMSFKNIDYCEIASNDIWPESEAYELFTTRFMFVIFKPSPDRTIKMRNSRTCEEITEQAWMLDKVKFWTMPTKDLETAHEFWLNIRSNVLENNINLQSMWRIGDRRKFHVRPKGADSRQLTKNPNGGLCNKYCYWFNSEYIKSIIEND